MRETHETAAFVCDRGLLLMGRGRDRLGISSAGRDRGTEFYGDASFRQAFRRVAPILQIKIAHSTRVSPGRER